MLFRYASLRSESGLRSECLNSINEKSYAYIWNSSKSKEKHKSEAFNALACKKAAILQLTALNFSLPLSFRCGTLQITRGHYTNCVPYLSRAVAISYFKWSRTHFHSTQTSTQFGKGTFRMDNFTAGMSFKRYERTRKVKINVSRSSSLMLSFSSMQWAQVARGDVSGVFTYACFIRVASIRWGACCAHPPVPQYKSRQMARAHLAAQNQKPTAWAAAHRRFSKFYIATKKWHSKMRSFSVCVCPVRKMNDRSRVSATVAGGSADGQICGVSFVM